MRLDVSIQGIPGQGGGVVEGREFEVVAVTFFGKVVVARYPTREQAEWRARELNEESERSPRGYVQYLVRPAEPRRESGR